MRAIKDLNLKQLQEILKSWGNPPFHAQQIFSWIYSEGACSFAQMSNLPLPLREKLKKSFCITTSTLKRIVTSSDGTKKLLLELQDNYCVEAVLIPSASRTTACISTQVGCKFRCCFCASGALGFKRNLTCAEILDEVLSLKNQAQQKKLTHIVFMGTGEPLDNYDNVLKAIRIINSQYAFGIGARRITLSTCGIIPAIARLAKERLQIELSISLHATDEKTRSYLMPINKTYPLRELLAACRQYQKETHRQITFEYVLIKGINSPLQNAKRFSTITKGLDCKVNLIAYNPVGESNFQPPEKAKIILFSHYLLKVGIPVTIRRPRGQDIAASCGQLRLRYDSR